MEVFTSSPQETYELGKKIGQILKPGMVICLSGEMGAGKTAISQGMVKGLGVDTYVTSPTYTIINEYEGEIPIYHFDVFRIEDVEELEEVGFDEYIYGEGIVIIEWASLIEEALPKELLWITIGKGKGFDDRIFTLTALGQDYQELLKEL